MRYLAFSIFAIALILGTTSAAFAQKIDTKAGLIINHSSEWEAGKPGKGVTAVLRSTSDPKTQIEFRNAGKMDVAKADQFFKSFHTNLQNAGLKIVVPRKASKYGKLDGKETEYVTKSAKGNYRLVVFQYHDAKHGAWLMVGFFSERQRETRYADLQKVLKRIDVAQK